jgi:hypothetical protein
LRHDISLLVATLGRSARRNTSVVIDLDFEAVLHVFALYLLQEVTDR